MDSPTALDTPFVLLPFRPASEPSAARNFVRSFFKAAFEETRQFEGEALVQELRLAEPLVGFNGPSSVPCLHHDTANTSRPSVAS